MKERRLFLGLSQEEVAEKANMFRANYAHIERGRHEPSIEQMEAIAKALMVKPELNFFANESDKS